MNGIIFVAIVLGGLAFAACLQGVWDATRGLYRRYRRRRHVMATRRNIGREVLMKWQRNSLPPPSRETRRDVFSEMQR